ncbi:hypothetical protein Tco_0324301 [Tanacetum coccineum]
MNLGKASHNRNLAAATFAKNNNAEGCCDSGVPNYQQPKKRAQIIKSLSPEDTHAVVWRNKADLDTMSMDDLYNNLKVYEPEVKGMSSSSSSTQNMAFVSSSNNNTSNTNEAVNTAHGVFDY